MHNLLLIGVSNPVGLNKILRDAEVRLRQLGLQIDLKDLISVYGLDGKREILTHGHISVRSGGIRFVYKGKDLGILIAAWKTEIIEGYSQITKPITIGVSVWVGGEPLEKAFTACIAEAIAATEGSEIIDSGRKWSNREISRVDEFEEEVRVRFCSG